MLESSHYRSVVVRPVSAALLLLPLGCASIQSPGDISKVLSGMVTVGNDGVGVSIGAAVLDNADIAAGLRDALRVGTERVVGQLGKADGFNADPDIHIPLPDALGSVQTALAVVGMAGLADDLELRLNRAAEAAVPEAKQVFWSAIKQLTLEDARAIFNGPSDAAHALLPGEDDPRTDPAYGTYSRAWFGRCGRAGCLRRHDGQLPQHPLRSRRARQPVRLRRRQSPGWDVPLRGQGRSCHSQRPGRPGLPRCCAGYSDRAPLWVPAGAGRLRLIVCFHGVLVRQAFTFDRPTPRPSNPRFRLRLSALLRACRVAVGSALVPAASRALFPIRYRA